MGRRLLVVLRRVGRPLREITTAAVMEGVGVSEDSLVRKASIVRRKKIEDGVCDSLFVCFAIVCVCPVDPLF